MNPDVERDRRRELIRLRQKIRDLDNAPPTKATRDRRRRLQDHLEALRRGRR